MTRVRLVTAILFGAPTAVLAHHSGLYDEQNIVTIEGTISAVTWVNPHVHISVTAVDQEGSANVWDVEATAINALERWGVKREWFTVGSRVAIKGPTSRFVPNALAGATVDFADGRHVVLWPTIAGRLKLADSEDLLPRAGGTGQDSQKSLGIFKVWTPRGLLTRITSLPLTESARVAKDAYVAMKDDPALRCIAAGMPVLLDTPYPIQFVDEGDQIVMRLEEWDGERTIYMTPGDAPLVHEYSPNGLSFGRWEGNTLAIFTTYIDYPYSDDRGTPQTQNVGVLERYAPTEDGARLDTEVTVTDPTTYTEPLVRRGWMSFEPDQTIKPYECTLATTPTVGPDP